MKQPLFPTSFSQSCVATALMLFTSLNFAGSTMDNQQLAEQLNQNWNQLFNKGDVKAVAILYSETALLSPGDGQVLQGQKAIEALFQSFVDGGVHNHKIEAVESYRDGDTLYQVANWQASGQVNEGVAPTFGGMVTLVSQRNANGEWKLQVHTWNTAPQKTNGVRLD